MLRQIFNFIGKAFRSSDAVTSQPIKSATNPADARVLRFSLGSSVGYNTSDHTTESFHFKGWNYVAIHSKAIQAAQATVRVIESTEDTDGDGSNDDVDVDEFHPLKKLLNRPNPKQSWAVFSYSAISQIGLTGRCTLWSVKNSSGTTCEVWVIPTGLMQPAPAGSDMPEGGWWVTPSIGQSLFSGTPLATLGWFRIDARDCRSVHWPHPMYPWDGVSPLSAGASIVDVSEELDEGTLASLRNRADIGTAMRVPDGTTSEECDRIQRYIDQQKAGTKNAGKTLVTSAELIQNGRSPVELDYVQGREQARNMVLALHRVPPVAAGITEAGSYSAFFASLLQFTELAVQPDLSLLAHELSAWLCPEFGDGLRIEIDARSISDPDLEERKLAADLSAKAITINEHRKVRKLPPVPWGDIQVGDQADMDGDGKPDQSDGGDVPDEGGDLSEGDGEDTGIEKPEPVNRIALHLNGTH